MEQFLGWPLGLDAQTLERLIPTTQAAQLCGFHLDVIFSVQLVGVIENKFRERRDALRRFDPAGIMDQKLVDVRGAPGGFDGVLHGTLYA